ncbi:allantoinase AllB [Cloacibacillus evryensis]|uniref:allantoinase AllB n=1 Tax=Cloacibacillus evryensis TaxID=508460 RepID=UPI00241E3D93|nr:allantoinase AllB [Cloacibacillus evryensis]
MERLLVKNAQILTEDDYFKGWVLAEDGRITALGSAEEFPAADRVIDAGGLTLLPGGVDPHVHIRYPGGAHRETFVTGTAAAAAGGVTTIIEHPISTPPQYSPETLAPRVAAVGEQAIVDVAFLGAAGGKHIEEIGRVAEAGVWGYKTFLHAAPEGREKEFVGLTSETNYELLKVMEEVKKTGLPMAAHGEDNDLVAGAIAELRREGRVAPCDHAASRPAVAEALAVDRLIRLAETIDCPLYLVHISTPEAVEAAKAARAKGMKVWIETCPQYLYLTEEALNEYGAYAKCNPALRDKARVEKMWDYIEDGTIDTVGSDHAPYTVEEKERNPQDIFLAPAGFPGLETRFGLMMKAVADGRISLRRAAELIAVNPAKAYGLYPRKGAIKIGADADFVLCDPKAEYTVEKEKMRTMAKDIAKVFDGWKLNGVIDKVILRGEVVYEEGQVTGEPGYGKCLLKGKA